MITRTGMGIVLIAGLCFLGSFLGTVTVRSQNVTTPDPTVESPVARRLQLDPEQAKVIEAYDPSFVDDLRTLRDTLQESRSLLAAAFEHENVTDDEIRHRVEAVIEAHNQLERRVVEYLIAVRDHLTPQQQRQLYGFCAEKVRECGKRWRRCWGRQDGATDGNGERENGPGRGRGPGPGRGRGREQRGNEGHAPADEYRDRANDDG